MFGRMVKLQDFPICGQNGALVGEGQLHDDGLSHDAYVEDSQAASYLVAITDDQLRRSLLTVALVERL